MVHFWIGLWVTFAIAVPVAADTIVGTSDGVRVELSYADGAPASSVRVRIARAGRVVHADTVPRENASDRPVVVLAAGTSIPVRDLDGDRDPEILLDWVAGGPRCCTYSLIYDYEPAAERYAIIRHGWDSVGYRLDDLDGDGVPEFDSADPRFETQFASRLESAYPRQIWQLRDGRLRDVTRQFPQAVYSSAAQNWDRYTSARVEGTETKGALAAYLADKYSLGEGEDGWQQVRAVYRESDREAFFRELQAFLEAAGYAPPAGTATR